MRTPLHTRLFCCCLAVLVLVSSMGFGMVEHWCQMRGHTKTLLAAQTNCPKTCQSDKSSILDESTEGYVLKRVPCCKTSLTYEHLDVSSFVADYHPLSAPQPAVFLHNPQFRLLPVALLPYPSAEAIPAVADTPLHRTGRFRLTSFCTWLI